MIRSHLVNAVSKRKASPSRVEAFKLPTPTFTAGSRIGLMLFDLVGTCFDRRGGGGVLARVGRPAAEIRQAERERGQAGPSEPDHGIGKIH